MEEKNIINNNDYKQIFTVTDGKICLIDDNTSCISEQFMQLYKEASNSMEGKTAENFCYHGLNRYGDIVPVIESRVILECGEYINANHVQYDDRKFIFAQAPVNKSAKVCGFPYFFDMLLENDVSVIVMLKNVNDIKLGKIDNYWSMFKSESIDSKKHIDKRVFEFKKENMDNKKTIVHFDFKIWEDTKALKIDDFDSLLLLHEQMISNLGEKSVPLIHCSAGVGRTGTFATISICINKIDNLLRGAETCEFSKFVQVINIPEIVLSLKKQRNKHTVQKVTQYESIFNFVVWYLITRYPNVTFF